MRVFISWSGDTSQQLARRLREWLPGVLQAVEPYCTPDDVAKGTRWNDEISGVLEDSRVGLICITRESLEAPWVMFEAGALSKQLDESKVVPILFGLEATDLVGPLVQFQAASFTKADMKDVVETINDELSEGKLAPEVLDNVFSMWWPRLEKDIRAVLDNVGDDTTETVRSEREILEEILTLVRAPRRTGAPLNPQAVHDLVGAYARIVDRAVATRDFQLVPLLKDLGFVTQHLAAVVRPQDQEKLAKSIEDVEKLEEEDLPF